jgi:hypothetical protein
MYIDNNTDYIRTNDPEGADITIIDLVGIEKLRIISTYRCFNPLNDITAYAHFRIQLGFVQNALTNNCTVHDGRFQTGLEQKRPTFISIWMILKKIGILFLVATLTQ